MMDTEYFVYFVACMFVVLMLWTLSGVIVRIFATMIVMLNLWITYGLLTKKQDGLKLQNNMPRD